MHGYTVFAAGLGLMIVAAISHADAKSNRPYWPSYEERLIPEGCVVWNWQQLSYYYHCPTGHRSKVVRSRG